MKYGFMFAKLAQEGKVVNVGQLPDYSDWSNESSWQVGDDVLYFSHKTKKFRLERFEWSDEEGDWLQLTPDLGHKEALQVALEENIIYAKV
jgi:hypothetical protein